MFKPSITFLQKVADREVYATQGYRGAQRFYGGKRTAEKHAEAGYIEMPAQPRSGDRFKLAVLTGAGWAALAAAAAQH